ncbi:MAG: 3-phosphoshikimate 1-carboxyvinyltransferase [Clostridiales bacterium]|nr:3-phosphoshikimate 1-carboxyvinyltransferase [Clostridiales bacterium]
MDRYEVKNIYGCKGELTVQVPGSKSITNRALLIAALAEGESLLDGILFSDDSRHFMACIDALGIKTRINEREASAKISGTGGKLPLKKAEINVGSAGTAARFLTAFLAMTEGTFHITSSEQMKKRPMKPLLDSLSSLGAEIEYDEKEGFFPFTIKGKAPKRGDVEIDIDKSSQFLSAFLISSTLFGEGINIHVKGTHGMNYINITTKMMEDFDVSVKKPEPSLYIVEGGSKYKGRFYRIEADVSAACYFYAVAAVLGITVTVKNVFYNSVQGDIGFIKVLEKMGCMVCETEIGISVTGLEGGRLKGIDADLSGFSDQALTLAAIAPYCEGEVIIRGIGHIRGQECDRIAAIINNLSAMGITAEDLGDGVKIIPGKVKPAEIETYDDHRVAMAFAVTGLRADGIVIKDPLCCRKTFENYFGVFDGIVKALKA